MRLKLGTYKNKRNKIKIVKIYSISNKKFADFIKIAKSGEVFSGEYYLVESVEEILENCGYKYVNDGSWD